MTFKSVRNYCCLSIAVLLLASVHASAQNLTVMVSGGFETAFKLLEPRFECLSGLHLTTILGPSMGATPRAIPLRLARGEAADVLIMARSALDELAETGKVVPGSQVDLVRSRIGMAVRAGTVAPDISSVGAFRRALLKARSVAYSDSASGVYIESKLFKRLGIAKEMAGKSRQVAAEPVGLAVARGEAEIGFQQQSELLAINGISVVGTIPDEVQEITIFSAGIVGTAREPDAGRTLIRYLSSPEACEVITRSGLEPIACMTQVAIRP